MPTVARIKEIDWVRPDLTRSGHSAFPFQSAHLSVWVARLFARAAHHSPRRTAWPPRTWRPAAPPGRLCSRWGWSPAGAQSRRRWDASARSEVRPSVSLRRSAVTKPVVAERRRRMLPPAAAMWLDLLCGDLVTAVWQLETGSPASAATFTTSTTAALQTPPTILLQFLTLYQILTESTASNTAPSSPKRRSTLPEHATWLQHCHLKVNVAKFHKKLKKKKPVFSVIVFQCVYCICSQ